MTNPFIHCVGAVASADIAVPRHDRELAFYKRVLGTGDPPLWRDDLMNNLGLPIIGLGARSPAYADLPLQWMPHIQVADVAKSVSTALRLGASELMHGKDEQGHSQWAVLTDPFGAAFGLIEVVATAAPPDEASAPDAPVGRIEGIALTVDDTETASVFYAEVVGWTVAQNAESTALSSADGRPTATVHPGRGDRAGLPTVWVLQLTVGDLDESLQRVEREGGQVLLGGVCRDPVGVCFGLVQG